MSNHLLLCHACFTWVLPRNDDCPECGRRIKLGDPDPPRSTLEKILGNVLFPIGRVRVRRKLLPERGLLYATTTGLFFLPDQQQDEAPSRVFSVERGVVSRILTIFRNRVFPKKPDFLPCRATSKVDGGDDLRPQLLQPNESRRLVDFLMENPGVFFVPRQSVRAMTRRFSRWTIQRVDGSRVRLKPETDARLFHPKMYKLLKSESWQQVARGAAIG
jgi:hypothetical protein